MTTSNPGRSCTVFCEVDKMVRWGAIVPAQERIAMIDYLTTNFPADKPPARPVKLPPAKTAPLKAAPTKATNAD